MHGHRWAFGSVLLTGAFDVQQFAETSALDAKGIPCQRFSYVTPAGATTGDLVAHGAVALHCIAEYAYEAPDPHHCLVDTIHKVTPGGSGPTATFLVQGPVETDTALVYTPADRDMATPSSNRTALYWMMVLEPLVMDCVALLKSCLA